MTAIPNIAIVDSDLMHWEERDTALYPDEDETMFSGSAIIGE